MATEILRPNSDSLTNLEGVYGSVSRYGAIDESSPDDDSSYVYETRYNASPTYYDMYGFPDMSEENDVSITSVTVYAEAKCSLSTQVAQLIIVHQTNKSGWKYLSTSYGEISHTWNTNPSTGEAWTKSDVNGLYAGIFLQPDSGKWQRCTQLYVEVEYTKNYSISSMATLNVSSSVSKTMGWIRKASRKFLRWDV